MLAVQLAARAFSRACDRAGNNIAARIAIIAITTSNSISVNDRLELTMGGLFHGYG